MGLVSRMEGPTLINTLAFGFSLTHSPLPLFLSPTQNCPLPEAPVQMIPPLPPHTHTRRLMVISHCLSFTFPYYWCCLGFDSHLT